MHNGALARTLFRDVCVFDSRAGRVTGVQDVLVEGNTIRSLAPPAPSPPPGEEATTVIDGGRRTLMPGLSPWPRRPTPTCLRPPARAARTPERWASSTRERWPTCCLSTAIR